jgi:Tn3 transposase DDE domain
MYPAHRVELFHRLDRYFGPISGQDAKVDRPRERYALTVFCYGCNLGPRRTARSINDLDRFKLAFVNQRHITEASLNQAIATVVNTYVQFSKNANHCSSESESPRVNGKLRNKAAVGLEACGDQHPARLADEPIHCEPGLLMKPAAGKKERGREVIRSAALPSSPRRKQSSGNPGMEETCDAKAA